MAQEGAIVRNKRTGAMGRVVNGQVVPIDGASTASTPAASSESQFPGIIRGAPAPVNPLEVRKDEIDITRGEQDITKGELDIQSRQLTLEEQQAKLAERELGAKLGKEAGFYLRARSAGEAFDALGVGAESQMRAAGKNILPEDWMNAWTPEERQKAETFMEDFIAASLRYESGAAIGQDEFDRQARIYFPQPGDSAGRLEAKRKLRQNMIASLGMGAGPDAVAEVDAYLGELNQDAPAGGDSEASEGQALLGWRENEDGSRAPIYGEPGTTPLSGDGYIPNPAAVEAARLNDITGELGAGHLMTQGLTLGLTDEASGIGTALGRALKGDFAVGENYRLGRDAQEMRLNQTRERLGGWGTAAEIGGSFALPANALARLGSVGAAARGGAVAGGVGGFGYGRDEASGNNALLGMAAGAALGAGGQKIGNALANRQTANLGDRARRLNAAGEAEGVTVNRAMVDPSLENKVTGVDASRVGGPRFQRGMDEIEGQIEGRVSRLGGNRDRVEPATVGDNAQASLDRFRESSREVRNRLYDRAHRFAGDARIEPKQAIAAIDEQIAELTASGQNANKGLIKYLGDIKADLSREGGLTIKALRDQRTGMRGQINERNLDATDAERRVGIVLDGASKDIRAALANNPRALNAYDRADAAHGYRKDFIREVMGKLTGPDNNRLSPGATARALDRWMKEDPGRFTRFWRALEPDERGELTAYVATNLGRSSDGSFSPSLFVNAISGKNRQLSDTTLRTVFGDEGFQSIQNLRLLSEEVKRVTGAMNSRKSGTSVGNDYRNWLLEITLGTAGGGVGLASGGGVAAAGTAAAAAGTAFAARSGRDILNARLLMSPKITKWLRQAPRTTNPQAIDAHFERLGEIAKAEPALAGEIDTLRRAIMGAANDNVGVSAAASDSEEN